MLHVCRWLAQCLCYFSSQQHLLKLIITGQMELEGEIFGKLEPSLDCMESRSTYVERFLSVLKRVLEGRAREENELLLLAFNANEEFSYVVDSSMMLKSREMVRHTES